MKQINKLKYKQTDKQINKQNVRMENKIYREFRA